MNSEAITNYLFEMHQDFINPKVIARRQVYRLVDKVLNKVAPHLALGELGMNTASATSLNSQVQVLHMGDNKENTSISSNKSMQRSTRVSEKNTSATLQMKLPATSNVPTN